MPGPVPHTVVHTTDALLATPRTVAHSTDSYLASPLANMPVLARFVDCSQTLHSPQDDRALLTYLTTSGLLSGRRNDCARTTSGMTVTIDSGELSVVFTKTGQQPIWAHVVVTNSQTTTFVAGSGSNRYDALVLEIFNTGTCPAVTADAQDGVNIARFSAVRGSTASAMTDNEITTALGHSNWLRIDDVEVPAAATQFGGGGSDAKLHAILANVDLSTKAKASLTTLITAVQNNLAFYALCTGSSNNYAATYASLPTTPVTGLRVYAKANFTNSAAANFNYNSFGNVAIKKLMGTADVASGDIPSGGLMELEYDGTYWQLLNPLGQITSITGQYQKLIQTTADSASFGASSTSEVDCPAGYQYTIGANTLAVGQEIDIVYEAYNELLTSGNVVLRFYLGSQGMNALTQSTAASNKAVSVRLRLICQAIGGSGTIVWYGESYNTDGSAYARYVKSSLTVDTTANLVIKMTAQFSVSNSQHKEHVTDFSVAKILTP